jgi:REP element-mobilizing transposase RayT
MRVSTLHRKAVKPVSRGSHSAPPVVGHQGSSNPNGVPHGGQSMPQSLAQIYLHLVFSTKVRRPFLVDRELRDGLHAYMAGICRNLDSPSIRIGGTADHVHVLCYLSRTHTVAETIRDLKRDSSKRTSSGRRNTTGANRFRMSSGACSRSTALSLMSVMSGTDVWNPDGVRAACCASTGGALRDPRLMSSTPMG